MVQNVQEVIKSFVGVNLRLHSNDLLLKQVEKTHLKISEK